MKKPNAKIILITVIFALAAANLLLFSGALNRGACFRDMCLYGETSDPVNEFRLLVNSSSKAIIIAEGDASPTQTTAYVDIAFSQLASDLYLKSPKLIAIAVKDGAAINCSCENYANGTFAACQNDLVYCTSIQPAQDEMMIILKYPSYAKNEAVIKSRTIELRANSGASLSGMVEVLRGLIKKGG
ncbi:MAG: hypothetical protein QXO69_01205 [archaeon]